jgi:hypothetical protein
MSPRTGCRHDVAKLPAPSTDVTTCTGVYSPGGLYQGEILDQGKGGRSIQLIAVEVAFEKTPAIPRC